ncbi:MAG: heavy metal translocating P-type ATPase [Anaerolineae bacterium]|jgi:Cd2+/Zn2+-exporting ATPase
MIQKLQLEIPLLLPRIADEHDGCVTRLQETLLTRRGVSQAHVTHENGSALLCLHYDPALVGLAEVRRAAEQAGAQLTDRYRHEALPIDGMDCADCALVIEHSLGRLDGVLTANVNYAAGRLWIEYDSAAVRRRAIRRRLQHLGYHVIDEKKETWWQRNWELVLIGLAGLFLLLGWAGQTFFGLPQPVAIGLFALAYVAGGYDASRHALPALFKLHFDTDVLMLLAAIGAAILGEWVEGAFLLFLFGLGHVGEHYAMDRARHAIQSLAELAPKTARVQRDGQELEVPVNDLYLGDVVLVRNGERIPSDGRVVRGQSAVDQSSITGESVPVDKGRGDEVFAGTVNGDGSLEVEVTKRAQDTTLSRVIQMVAEAQGQKSPTQRFTERFTRIFVPAVLTLDVLVIVLPPLLGWTGWSDSFFRGMVLLVAASPCALAIGTPASVLAGIAQAARSGVLIKGGVHLETLGALDALAFDKTGTITRGQLEVTDVISADRRPPSAGGPKRDVDPSSSADAAAGSLLSLAAAVESRSSHPLARAIVRAAEGRGLALPETGDLEAVGGRGVRSSLDGQPVLIGNLKLFEAEDIPVPDHLQANVQKLEQEGKTTMVVYGPAPGGGVGFLGVISVADTPRQTARIALQELKQLGIRKTVMLTGDNERVAAAIAQWAGLTDYRANLLPEQKVEAVKSLTAEYGQVAMVGDGVNDAPALAQATVGIAMGGAGTDVALETADVALMADDLSRLPFAVGLSRATRRVIHQNLAIALSVILLLIATSVAGVVGLSLAVVLHEGSTLVVVANALRLLGFKGE